MHRTTWLQQLKLRWYKITHWEFWSFMAIYLPVIPYYLFLSAKARSFFFFNAANPGIKNGGFLMESKWEIYQQLPEYSYPRTILLKQTVSANELLRSVHSFTYPVVAKPDIGGKGRGVAVVYSEQELLKYHGQTPVDYLVQQFISFPNEIGVFYIKDPVTGKGKITGVVEKQFLQVTGDGKQTIYQLLLQTKRFRVYINDLVKQLGIKKLETVPVAGAIHTLVPVGNHARGAVFFDVTKKTATQLQVVMDDLCAEIPDFYFGRLDIRFASWEKLFEGKEYAIIELNGAGSEPTHMYDPANSLWKGWKEIILHWHWLYTISRANHQRGYRYLSFSEGLQMLRDVKAYDRLLDKFVFKQNDNKAKEDSPEAVVPTAKTVSAQIC